jgi:uncharacterized protein YjbI with pentapeptide repeats
MDFRSFLVNLLKVPSRVLRSVFLNRADRQHSSRSQTQKSRRRLSFEEIVNIIRLNNGPEGVDLSNTDLTEVDLSGLDLKGVNFSRSSLRKTSFTRCHLSGADFSFSNCAGADFFRANMALAKLVHTYFRSANFVEASLYRANLTGADFLRADLRRVNLHRANLTDTKLSREALGDRILQESKDDYRDYLKRILSVDRREERVVRQMKWRLHDAEQVYRSLKNLFTSTGQYSDASWAYVREMLSKIASTKSLTMLG